MNANYDTSVAEGRITARAEVSAEFRPINPDSSIPYQYGVAGVLMAAAMSSLSGQSAYTNYTISQADGTDRIISSTSNFPIGTCVVALVEKSRENDAYWKLEEVRMKASDKCLR